MLLVGGQPEAELHRPHQFPVQKTAQKNGLAILHRRKDLLQPKRRGLGLAEGQYKADAGPIRDAGQKDIRQGVEMYR